MATYNYQCLKCTIGNYEDSSVVVENIYCNPKDGEDYRLEPLVWEVSYSSYQDKHTKIFEYYYNDEKLTAPPEIFCPLCKKKAVVTFLGVRIHGFTKGQFLKDKDGCKREMDLHKLKNDDPFGEHRESGEKDYLISKLEKEGSKKMGFKYQDKPKPSELPIAEKIQKKKGIKKAKPDIIRANQEYLERFKNAK